MSIMKMYVEEYLAAEQVAENRYIIHLSNGKEIEVTEHPVHNGNMWDWKIDSQVFDTDDYALNYLKKLVAEKLTGKRILLHKKREKPDSGVRYYEIKDKRYTQAELDAMSNEKYNSEVFTFSVIYRYMELEKPLTGAFTIEGLTKKMDALRKAHHLL